MRTTGCHLKEMRINIALTGERSSGRMQHVNTGSDFTLHGSVTLATGRGSERGEEDRREEAW